MLLPPHLLRYIRKGERGSNHFLWRAYRYITSGTQRERDREGKKKTSFEPREHRCIIPFSAVNDAHTVGRDGRKFPSSLVTCDAAAAAATQTFARTGRETNVPLSPRRLTEQKETIFHAPRSRRRRRVERWWASHDRRFKRSKGTTYVTSKEISHTHTPKRSQSLKQHMLESCPSLALGVSTRECVHNFA